MNTYKNTMRIIHTSDWHLGQTWDRRSRYEEFARFLDWMFQTVLEQNADVLIVAGDIFDNQTPSPAAQTLYYNFLRRMLQTNCQTVITAGNHDSPQLIDAPGGLLTALQIHVIGEPDSEKELIKIEKNGKTELLVAAVPFLRDRNLRRIEVGESAESREQKSLDGLKQHYQNICNQAEEHRRGLDGGDKIPLIVTGHLFVQGGATSKGVRELYVGTLGDVGTDIFPANADYVALGHLHIPQQVAGSEFIRYSGSPIPMSFDEAKQEKSVVRIDFEDRTPTVTLLPIPKFSNVICIEGDVETIKQSLTVLAESEDKLEGAIYVDVLYTGSEIRPDLNGIVREAATDFIEKNGMLQIRVQREISTAKLEREQTEKLEELTPMEIFRRRLHAAEKDQSLPKAELEHLYHSILDDII